MLMSVPFVCGTFYMMWNPSELLSESMVIVWMAAAGILFYTSMTAFSPIHLLARSSQPTITNGPEYLVCDI